MKVVFDCDHGLVQGDRGKTIIDMIHKGETERTENGKNFRVIVKPDRNVVAFISTKEVWVRIHAHIKMQGNAGHLVQAL
jgi:hypothetical protein